MWDGLNPAELAAVLSAVLFESRGDGPTVPPGSEQVTDEVRRALAKTRRLWTDIHGDERQVHRLPFSREPDAGFAAAMYSWATYGDLTAALLMSDNGNGNALPAGDFVRWCRQVLDLPNQVRIAAPSPQLLWPSGPLLRYVAGAVAIDTV
ncbi:RNA helicase [Mycolicibacterium aubagnense]